jgi:predicted small secreted protein
MSRRIATLVAIGIVVAQTLVACSNGASGGKDVLSKEEIKAHMKKKEMKEGGPITRTQP